MEFLTFFGGVWGSIILGVAFILMVIGCSFDRNNVEEAKWCIFWIGLVALIGIQYFFNLFSAPVGVIKSLDMRTLITYAGIYLGIGLAYSVLEFVLNIRRSARFWESRWADYKTNVLDNMSRTKKFFADKESKNTVDDDGNVSKIGTVTHEKYKDLTNAELVKGFLSSGHVGQRYYSNNKIVGIKTNEDKTNIEPEIDRGELAQAIGCWTFWWPFYAVSLIIGDLFTEIFNVIANILASISGRFVKLMFKDSFKF